MKNLLPLPRWFGVSAFLPLVLALPAAAAEETPLPLKATAVLAAGGQPVKIVCFGDSVTGVYYHTGGRRAYPEMLRLALERFSPKAAVQVVNAGVSGNSTQNALARLDRDVLQQRPQLVTVMFGLNDVVRVPLEEFRGNLTQIIVKCRQIDAEVVLCTPNSVIDTAGRPTAKLLEYLAAIRQVAREQRIPLADCYAAFEAFRAQDAAAWEFLMSDEIHPNMDGHKLMAKTIAHVLCGRDVALDDVGPPAPAIPKTLALLKSGQPIRVFAMPPFDRLIGPALQRIVPTAQVEVTVWPVADQTLGQIEQAAKRVRGLPVDLVIIAVPANAAADSPAQEHRSYTWVLNHSLSFDYQKWDCIAATPLAVERGLTGAALARDQLARRLIRAQDLGMLDRNSDDQRPLDELLAAWLAREWKSAPARP
jgi:lysophospholipase L1-like esterase